MSSRKNTVQEFIEAEKHPHKSPAVKITGLDIQYYCMCKRELWFSSRGIDIDRSTKNIQRGTHIDENAYRDARDSFMINNRIALDRIDSGEILEVKASSNSEHAATMQLVYYLWYLKYIADVDVTGVLAFPTENKRKDVTLTQDRETEIENIISDIISIVKSDDIPELEKKPFCDSCLYQDICWV